MEMRLPIKIRIKNLEFHEKQISGKVLFHEKEFNLKILHQKVMNVVKIPLSVIGVAGDKILIRVSGPSGVYVEDYVMFQGESEFIEIFSEVIFSEIKNYQNKFDTIEIFIK
tara:strand:+ start:1809 stop:2141 length:333 start_codon:yes stop_codon:yes gene_type:complete